MSGVLCHLSPPYFLRQSLLLSPELSDLATLASHLAPRQALLPSLLLFTSDRLTHMVLVSNSTRSASLCIPSAGIEYHKDTKTLPSSVSLCLLNAGRLAFLELSALCQHSQLCLTEVPSPAFRLFRSEAAVVLPTQGFLRHTERLTTTDWSLRTSKPTQNPHEHTLHICILKT